MLASQKNIYPIFGKVLCRTLKLIILFKNHIHFNDHSTQFCGDFTKEEREFCQVCESRGPSVLQTGSGVRPWRDSSFAGLKPSAGECTCPLDRDRRGWDTCQVAFPVAPCGMLLFVARRRPFTLISGGKTGAL